MHTVNLAENRDSLTAVVARVLRDSAPTVVNTPEGECVVVLPMRDFESWQETSYLLRTPANAAHLRKSIAEAEAGAVESHDLSE